MIIIAFMLQGRAMVLTSDDDLPSNWPSVEAASEFLDDAYPRHMGLRAATDITIIDVPSGEATVWL